MDDRSVCVYAIELARTAFDQVKKMLDPKTVFESGCRVIKRPQCCILCKNNEDCSRIPMHIRCHCEREPYLTFFD